MTIYNMNTLQIIPCIAIHWVPWSRSYKYDQENIQYIYNIGFQHVGNNNLFALNITSKTTRPYNNTCIDVWTLEHIVSENF